jgi:thymidylate synthase
MTLNKHDKQYHDLVQYVLDNGIVKQNRTGKPARSVFGYQMRFNLRDGTIPMLTTKKMFTRGIVREILWYMMGTGDISYLKEHNVTIWDEWADKSGQLGPVYGVMWRSWPNYVITEFDNPADEPLFYVDEQPIDQIGRLVHLLRTNPEDRRMIVTGWNPSVLPDTSLSFDQNVAMGNQALPPCHYTFQCYARPLTEVERMKIAGKTYSLNDVLDNESDVSAWLDDANIPRYELSLMLNQRSCDVGLGVPFNIVQYSILLRMLCEVANMVPGDFVWNGGDVHIYENHVDKLRGQLLLDSYDPPKFKFTRPVSDIDDFKYEDFVIEGYQSHPTITMDVAV